MTMPNFLIIGAAKSGTTALYHCLKQHPQIYMSPVKEPGFFAFEGERPQYFGPGDDKFTGRITINLKDYQELFAAVDSQIAIGEASQAYLSRSEVSAIRIQQHTPRAKLIAVLRHPVERAYSNYLMLTTNGREYLGFTQALDEEEARMSKQWSHLWAYKMRGLYHARLQPYFARFPREQIRIYLYEDWNTKLREVLQDMFRFLQVDDTFIPDLTMRHNVSHPPYSQTIQVFLNYPPNTFKTFLKPLLPKVLRHKIVEKMVSINRKKTPPPPMDPELRRELTEAYRDDILKLQDLIGRDLSHWIQS